MKILEIKMRNLGPGLVGLALAAAPLVACQSYNMEGVEPRTVVAVETAGDFTVGKAPSLLIVQDRSGSMRACFPASGAAAPGQRCDSDSDVVEDRDGASRMHVSQRVMSSVVGEHQDEVLFGLVLYGVSESSACGDPLQIATPGSDTDAARRITSAYAEHPAITSPVGGTPTTHALDEAYRVLVDETTGKVKMPERDNYVVLVTDGLMNCNADHPMPCVCASENGCVDTSNQRVEYGESGELYPEQCLDDAASLAAVQRLHDAGVKTFVIGVGFAADGGGSNIATTTLNALAEAGGVPRDGVEKYYSAADEASLQASLDDIIDTIVVPCEYELDGPVCDGRLVSINLRIDGEDVAATCGEGDGTWNFVRGVDGELDQQRITFSPDLCGRFASSGRVQISIRGVENACEYDEGGAMIGPACDLSQP